MKIGLLKLLHHVIWKNLCTVTAGVWEVWRSRLETIQSMERQTMCSCTVTEILGLAHTKTGFNGEWELLGI